VLSPLSAADRAKLLRLAAICQGCGTDYQRQLERNGFWHCERCHPSFCPRCSRGTDFVDKLDLLASDLVKTEHVSALMATLTGRVLAARGKLEAAGISWWDVAQHFVGTRMTILPDALAERVRKVLNPPPTEEKPSP
jgi:hypothetical protein